MTYPTTRTTGRLAAGLALAVALFATSARAAKPVTGRYVRIDIPGVKTLSLAEVQVFSGKTNVALKCKTTQSSVGHSGAGSRAVDGNADGEWGRGSITHTVENIERVVEIAAPFYMARFEVTNAQFARFAPKHDSRYIDGRGKDRSNRGRPINGPTYPAVRMTWKQADAFAKWLTKTTGYRCSLPTEEQWEYARRAGAAGPLPRGRTSSAPTPGNRARPNAWGLCDLEDNVAEWTATDYDAGAAKVYQTARPAAPLKGVRGSTWDDKLRMAPTTARWRYPNCQPVYNVGFRVVCEAPDSKVATEE